MYNIFDEYCEYSNINRDTLFDNILKYQEILDKDIDNMGEIYLIESKNLILDSIRHRFNNAKPDMINKYMLFSPHMLGFLKSHYNTFLDLSSIGLISEYIKDINPDSIVHFHSMNTEISKFAMWRYEKNDMNISVGEISEQYDVVISDGVVQYLSTDKQFIYLNNILTRISPDGIFVFMADIIKEEPIKKYVDIVALHSLIEDKDDMVCIYGKNTFSSLWKKII